MNKTKRTLLKWLGSATVGFAIFFGWLYVNLTGSPDLSAYSDLGPSTATDIRAVRSTFLGVSTILFDDGETQIMTDGFFTRPSIWRLLGGKISSDPAIITSSLSRAGATKLAALIICHSHYDHAMDAAAVSLSTGAVVIGSNSTANIALGGDVPADKIRTPKIGETLTFGKFRITLLPSAHAPSGYPTGLLTEPLHQPARADAYRLGSAYAVLIEHHGKSVVVNSSAGFEPGALSGRKVETVFLGIGQLGKKWKDYKSAYWHELVETPQAKQVVAIHWDNFARPLDESLQALPWLLDDLDASMQDLSERGIEQHVKIYLPQAWQVFDPFAPGE